MVNIFNFIMIYGFKTDYKFFENGGGGEETFNRQQQKI